MSAQALPAMVGRPRASVRVVPSELASVVWPEPRRLDVNFSTMAPQSACHPRVFAAITARRSDNQAGDPSDDQQQRLPRAQEQGLGGVTNHAWDR
jgi:hypothetical protein